MRYEVEVDESEILSEIDDETLIDEMKNRKILIEFEKNYDDTELANSYFHGDLDLKPLFNKIGVEEIQKNLNEMRK